MDEKKAKEALAKVTDHGKPQDKSIVVAAVKKRFPNMNVDGEIMRHKMMKTEASRRKAK